MLNTGNYSRRRYQRGFTIMEVALALVIFMMMTLMFAATFPIATKAAHYGNNYSQAALLAQHKFDQLRSAGYGNLNYTALVNLGIVDQNPSATGPNYTFTGVDNLASFFPNGSTGTITISDDSSLSNVSSAPNPPPAGNVTVCTITISWPGLTSVVSTYSTSGMIVSMVHQ